MPYSMKTSVKLAALDELSEMLSELIEPDDVTEILQFRKLCRRSLAVGSWLFVRLAAEAPIREDFRLLLTRTAAVEFKAERRSQKHAKSGLGDGSKLARIEGAFGGLSKPRILTLIMRYQYHGTDLKTFMLIRLWLRLIASGKNRIPVRLWRTTLKHLRAIIADREGRLLYDALHAIRFFHGRSNGMIKDIELGYNDAWKMHVLLYILRTPKERYSVRELRAILPIRMCYVARRSVRHFCQLHGIQRDTTPGVPRGFSSRLSRNRYLGTRW